MLEKPATISSFDIFIEDHGILTFFIQLNYEDGGSQGAGGYALDGQKNGQKTFAPQTGHIIRYLLEAFDVERLEQLKGKPCWALMSGDGWDAKVIGIRPFGKKYDPLIFRTIFKS